MGMGGVRRCGSVKAAGGDRFGVGGRRGFSNAVE